jgi:putative flippase GtrA
VISAHALKFGVVGVVGYVIDVGVFNALRVDTANGPILQSSFMAKVISVGIATTVTWLGNRYWTFRERRRRERLREFVEFSLVAIGGLGIALLCLLVSRNVLGFTSLLADNVAANIIGLGLGTLFRFFMFRYWVYGDRHKTS